MPHETFWEQDGIYRKFTGQISGEEILSSNFDLQSDPRFLAIKYIINDFTDVTAHNIETNHTKVYAKTDDIASSSKGALKIALVVSRDDLMSLANQYKEEMKGKLFNCEIFNTLQDSRSWVIS